MKKLQKIIPLLLCAAALVIGLVACQPPENTGDGKVAYTVKVVCPEDDITLPDILQVKLTDADGNDVTTAQSLVGGVATFQLEPGTYKVALVRLPSKYATPDATLTATTRTVTVTITDKANEDQNTKVVYKIKLLTPEDRPVANTAVQLCGGGVGDSYACHQAETDAAGIATYELVAGNYDIHVASSEWPTGLVFDDEKYKVTAADKDTTVSVYFDSLVAYSVRIKYAAGKDDNGADIPERPASNIAVSLFREYSQDSYAPTATGSGVTDMDGIVTVTVPKANYLVRISCPTGYTYTQGLIVDKDQSADDKLDILLTELGSSEGSAFTFKEGDTTINVTKKSDFWYYNFNAQGKPGVYEIKASASKGKAALDTYAEHYAGNSASGMYFPVGDDNEYYSYTEDNGDDDKNFTLRFGIKPDELSGSNVFGFKFGARNVADTDKPTTFVIRVSFVEIIEDTTLPCVDAEAGTLKAAPAIEPDTVPTRIDYGGIWSIDYDQADGYYRKAGGPIVYVSVGHGTTADYLPLILEESNKDFVEAYDEAGVGFTFPNRDNTKREDYGKFLKAYKAAANADGLYPLTPDMLYFLQCYAANGLAYNLGIDPAIDDLYLFACYTYESIYETPSGTGAQDDPYILQRATGYKFTVDAAATLYFRSQQSGTVTLVSGDAVLCDSTGAELSATSLTIEVGSAFIVKATGATEFKLTLEENVQTPPAE